MSVGEHGPTRATELNGVAPTATQSWSRRLLYLASEVIIGAGILSVFAPWLWIAELLLRCGPWLAVLTLIAMAINRKRPWVAAAAWLSLAALAWPSFDVRYRIGSASAPAPDELAAVADVRILDVDLRGWQADEAAFASFAEAVAACDPQMVIAMADSDRVFDQIKDLPNFDFEVELRLRAQRQSVDGSESDQTRGWLCVLARRRLKDWTTHAFADPAAVAGSGVLAVSDERALGVVIAAPPSVYAPRGYLGRHEQAQRLSGIVADQKQSAQVVIVPRGWSLRDPEVRDLMTATGLQGASGLRIGFGPTWLPALWRADDALHLTRGTIAHAVEALPITGHQRDAALWQLSLPSATGSDR